MKSNSKWKQGFLKTGLPLEYVTSNVFSKLGHEIFGEYPYIRPNENKELKEFSVDIRTHKCLDSEGKLIVLSTLVECKYRQPGTCWVFSPFPSEMISTGLVQSNEELVPVRLNGNSLYEFENNIGYCISGIEITNDGGGNTNGAKHGVFQLRFAMPVMIKSDYEHTMSHNWSDGRYIDLLCPILVTTAEIRVIKQNLDLEDFLKADDLDDVSEIRKSIILNERAGPQLQEFADSLAEEFIENHPELELRLSELDSVLTGKEWESRSSPDLDTIRRNFGQGTERVLIVNYNHLEETIKNLEEAILEQIKSEKVYGTLINKEDGFSITKL